MYDDFLKRLDQTFTTENVAVGVNIAIKNKKFTQDALEEIHRDITAGDVENAHKIYNSIRNKIETYVGEDKQFYVTLAGLLQKFFNEHQGIIGQKASLDTSNATYAQKGFIRPQKTSNLIPRRS